MNIRKTKANDIIAVFDRVGDRWKTVESILDDIKVCIFSSVTLQEKDIDEKVEKVEASLTDYADKYTKLKKDKRETLNRVYDYIEKVKQSNQLHSCNQHIQSTDLQTTTRTKTHLPCKRLSTS